MNKEESSFNEITKANLILSANKALLCEIRPNMRKICIEYLQDENTIVLSFIYDSPPTQEQKDYDVEGTILAEMSSDFSQELKWEERSLVLPYPQRMPELGICVFRRYEP